MPRNLITYFLLAISLVLLIKVLFVTDFFSSSRYQPDFDAYYLLIKDIKNSTNPYAVANMQTLGPPLVFLYFYPFSVFPLHQAQTLNMTINLIAGYLCCAVLAIRFFKNYKLPLFLILSTVYYTAFLSRYSIQIGQPNLLISLLIALIISSPKSQPYFISALFTVKTFFVFTLFSLIRSPRKLVRTSIFFLGAFLLSLAIIRPQWYSDYTFRRFPEMNVFHTQNYSDSLHYENQSIPALFSRFGLADYLPYTYPLLIAAAVILTSLTGSLELGILFSYLLSPVLWQHYFIGLFPIFIKSFAQTKNFSELLLISLSLFLWFPDLRLWTEPVNIYYGIFASHFLFSLILLTIAQIPQLRYNSNTY